VNNIGLVEVPMGTTVGEMVFIIIGGGIPGGKKFKAVQTGGPSGGCIPDPYLNTTIDYESFKELYESLKELGARSFSMKIPAW